MFTWLNDLLFCLDWPWPLLIIIFSMGVIGLLALKLKQLTLSGALAAIIEGTVVLWCLRFEGFFIFFLFYFSCIVIGKYVRMQDRSIKQHGSRESLAVLANGCMASIAALLYYNSGSYSALIMFGASVAEAASDTWAGEIGRLSVKPPISIRTSLEVKKGTSGGVTPLGFIAAFTAVVFIGIVWMCSFPIPNRGIAFTIICFTGFLGCVVDSFIGATCQALYEDKLTGELTENEKAASGEDNKLVRGFAWMDNDAVNFASNLVAAMIALGLGAILF